MEKSQDGCRHARGNKTLSVARVVISHALYCTYMYILSLHVRAGTKSSLLYLSTDSGTVSVGAEFPCTCVTNCRSRVIVGEKRLGLVHDPTFTQADRFETEGMCGD
jgi:hypothetical protein